MIRFILVNYKISKKLSLYFSSSLLIGCLLGLFQYVLNPDYNLVNSRNYMLVNYNSNAINTLILLLIPLLVSTLITNRFFKEIELSNYIYSRFNFTRYTLFNIFVVSIVGFILVFTFYSSNYLIMNLSGINLKTVNINMSDTVLTSINQVDVPFYSLFINNFDFYIFLYILLISTWSGLNAALSYSIALFSKNRITSYVLPFLIGVGLMVVSGLFKNGIVVWYPSNILQPFPLLANNPNGFTIELGLIVVFLIYIVLSIIFTTISFYNEDF